VNDSSKWNDSGEAETEISLADIVEFIQETWKQLVLAGIAGAVLGFGGWYILGSYKAELILLNNTNTNTNTNIYGLDLVAWITLYKSLPNLARQIAAQDNLPAERKAIYGAMSDPEWWIKNVSPSYALLKADTKGLAIVSKDLDSATTQILSFMIFTDGQSKESSLNNVRIAAEFFRTGGAYLQLKSLINSYEGETSTVAEIRNQLTQTQVNQNYYRERIKTLEDLLKRFPNRGAINMQPLDSKENSPKYLPVENQLIAVNNDLNNSKELIARLNDRLARIVIVKQFLEQAVPMVDTQTDGLLLTKSLLNIEAKLRSNLSAGDLIGQLALDQLRSQIVAIESRFFKGLETSTVSTTKKIGMLIATAAGIAITGFAMLAFLLGRKITRNLKLQRNPRS